MDLQTDWEIGVHLRRASWLMHAAQVKFKAARLAEALRAYAKYNPSQPRVPRGSSDGGQWTDGGGSAGDSSSSETLSGGAGDDDLSKVPTERPQDIHARNRAVRRLARFILTLIKEEEVGRRIAPILDLLNVGSWVADEYTDLLQSALSEPKTLEELQGAVARPTPGTQVHHIVEQGPAGKENLPRTLIDSPNNLVRIPTIKHEQITGWFGRPNKDFGGLAPREYLRGKDWAERTKVGLRAMIENEVLKP